MSPISICFAIFDRGSRFTLFQSKVKGETNRREDGKRED